MKYLLLLVILAVVGLAFFGRRRPRPPTPPTQPGKPSAQPDPQTMLACAHCGVHLPQAEARMDVAGRPYCGDAHRLLGPR
jgi:uncharacterized protein